MKIVLAKTINRSRDEVWASFDNPENLKKWQPTLRSFEHISGEPGQPGAVSNLIYDEGGKEVVLKETVTVRQEPEAFEGIFEADSVTNHIKHRFTELDNSKTHWQMETEFTFKSLPMRLMAPLMRGMMVKRTEQNMQDFIIFAEK